MNLKIIAYISILAIIIVSTSFITNQSQTSELLFQKWVYEDYQNGSMLYESKRKFIKDKPGIEFKVNGTIIRKQNSGWCGTPPIDYEIVTGTWKSISDSVLVIEYKIWSGPIKDTVKIVKLTTSNLNLRPIYGYYKR